MLGPYTFVYNNNTYYLQQDFYNDKLITTFNEWENGCVIILRVYSQTRVKSRVSTENDGTGGDAVNVVTAASGQKNIEQINHQWK